MWRWAILETYCLETLPESSVKALGSCLCGGGGGGGGVCTPTYVLCLFVPVI